MFWTLPNTLTLLRLFAAPAVAILFLFFARPIADWVALALFVTASVTDFLDGYLARAWKQESRFGAMLDPIADKAMVIIALLVIVGFSSWSPWLVLPATMIVFREVFVSGLREFLGSSAKTLKVTALAKWKTTMQMIAIGVLFGQGIFQHHLCQAAPGTYDPTCTRVLNGDLPVELGYRWLDLAHQVTGWIGLALLWVAALMTLVTGWDYFRKALPYLKEPS